MANLNNKSNGPPPHHPHDHQPHGVPSTLAKEQWQGMPRVPRFRASPDLTQEAGDKDHHQSQIPIIIQAPAINFELIEDDDYFPSDVESDGGDGGGGGFNNKSHDLPQARDDDIFSDSSTTSYNFPQFPQLMSLYNDPDFQDWLQKQEDYTEGVDPAELIQDYLNQLIHDLNDRTFTPDGKDYLSKDPGIDPKRAFPNYLSFILTNHVRTKEEETARVLCQAAQEQKRVNEQLAAQAAQQAQAQAQAQALEAKLEQEAKERAIAQDLARATSPDQQRKLSAESEVFEFSRSAEHLWPQKDKDRKMIDKMAREAEALPVTPHDLTATGQHFLISKGGKGRKGGIGGNDLGIDETLHRRWSRTLWRAEMNSLEPDYRLPILILKKHQYIKKNEPTRIGPGTYDIDYERIQKEKRLATTRGLLRSCSSRFVKEKVADATPNPGSYGNTSTKWFAYCDRNKHPGKVPLFLSGPCDVRKNLYKGSGSRLGPGQYKFKSGIEELLTKQTSTRGPYDLYTPPRDVIPYGYYKTSAEKLSSVGPGEYNLRKSLKQEYGGSCHRFKGVLSSAPRERKMTGERIVLVSPLWPVHAGDTPGPGAYDPEPFHPTPKENRYPFNSSAKIRVIDYGNYDMAPDKYRPELERKYCPTGCGWVSNFDSKAGRLDALKIAALSERLRAKDLPAEERIQMDEI